MKTINSIMAGALAALAAAAAAPSQAAPDQAPATSTAGSTKWVKSIPYAVALKGALAGLACAERMGSHTSVGVMDYAGQWKVLLTPDNATMIGVKVLPLKMNAALLRQAATSPTVKQSVPPARAEIDTSGNVLERIAPGMAVISPGAVPLFRGEGRDREFVGVLGVAGATTPGDVDTVCANEGAAAIKADLNN
jgi:uncharacterized protein GlcG (DUF336 family)